MKLRLSSLIFALGGTLCAILPGTVSAEEIAPNYNNLILADIPTSQSTNRHGAAVRRTVRSMIDYTKWPNTNSPRTLCVVGRSRFGANLDRLSLVNGNRLRSIQKSANTNNFDGCDILYLGQLSMRQMRTATQIVRGKAVLTIAENDPECRSQSMFCLVFDDQSMTFRLNIDSISRSGVRVDPRVLRLAKGG